MSRGTPIIEAYAFDDDSGRWRLRINEPGKDHAWIPSERFDSYEEARLWFGGWLEGRGGGTAVLRNIGSSKEGL